LLHLSKAGQKKTFAMTKPAKENGIAAAADAFFPLKLL
jgi:hypothetical protein